MSFKNSIFKITIEITLDTTQNGIGDNIKYDDQNDEGNDNFKLEGCVKGNQVENADYLQSIALENQEKMLEWRKIQKVGCVKLGIDIHLKNHFDKVRASILEVSYKDLTSSIRLFNNGWWRYTVT